MKILAKKNIFLINGFLVGVLVTSVIFHLAKHPSYEECVIDNLPVTHSDQAARMLHVICKRIKYQKKYGLLSDISNTITDISDEVIELLLSSDSPEYDFSEMVNPFEKDEQNKSGWVFKDELEEWKRNTNQN